MKIIRTSFDRHEERRDRRYPVPPLFIRIAGAEYTTANWSLGGFLIKGFSGSLEVDAPVAGEMRFVDQVNAFPFIGRVVRLGEPEPGELAVEFTERPQRVTEQADARAGGLRRSAGLDHVDVVALAGETDC